MTSLCILCTCHNVIVMWSDRRPSLGGFFERRGLDSPPIIGFWGVVDLPFEGKGWSRKPKIRFGG